MPFCSKCGTEVPIEVSFCSKCGNKLQGEQSPTPTPTITPKVEVSTQSDETKPTLYNPIAIACWGLVSPLFSFIMFYLNYKTLVKALPMLPTNNEPKSNNDLFGDVKPQDEFKAIRTAPIGCIGGCVAIIVYYITLFLPIKWGLVGGLYVLVLYIAPFLAIVEFKKHIKSIYGSEEYNKKPLLIPVIIMIVVECPGKKVKLVKPHMNCYM